jgi:hypothetical protein
MFRPNQMVHKAIYTPAAEPVELTPPTCRTGNCTWSPMSTLAICIKHQSSYTFQECRLTLS